MTTYSKQQETTDYLDHLAAWAENTELSVTDVSDFSFRGSHQAFVVDTSKGKMLVKILSNEHKAKVEQDANRWLPMYLDFVVPGYHERPVEFQGKFMTSQYLLQDREQDATHTKQLENLARLHVEGEGILTEGLLKPTPKLKLFDEVYAGIKENAGGYPIKQAAVFALREQYEEGFDALYGGEKVCLHGDPKSEHWIGHYLVDLEDLALGDAAFDVAFILNDTVNPIDPSAHQTYAAVYAEHRGLNKKEFWEKVQLGKVVRALTTLSWNTANADRNRVVSDQKVDATLRQFHLKEY